MTIAYKNHKLSSHQLGDELSTFGSKLLTTRKIRSKRAKEQRWCPDDIGRSYRIGDEEPIQVTLMICIGSLTVNESGYLTVRIGATVVRNEVALVRGLVHGSSKGLYCSPKLKRGITDLMI